MSHALKQNQFLSMFPYRIIGELARYLKTIKFKPGQVIAKEDEKAKFAYFLYSG